MGGHVVAEPATVRAVAAVGPSKMAEGDFSRRWLDEGTLLGRGIRRWLVLECIWLEPMEKWGLASLGVVVVGSVGEGPARSAPSSRQARQRSGRP